MLLGAPNLFRPSIQLTQSNPSFTNCSGSSAKRPIRHLKASFQAARISHQHRKFTLTAAMFHLLMFSFRCCATEHVSDSCHLLHFLKSAVTYPGLISSVMWRVVQNVLCNHLPNCKMCLNHTNNQYM